ncbi:MAG: flagellar hook-length control protein FliK [Rhizobiaceae bacterium]
MNLPTNLPVAVSSAASTRAEKLAEKDAAGMKFDDILSAKPNKGSAGSREARGDAQTATWSWTRIELPKNKMGWEVKPDADTLDEAPDLTTAGPEDDAAKALPEDSDADALSEQDPVGALPEEDDDPGAENHSDDEAQEQKPETLRADQKETGPEINDNALVEPTDDSDPEDEQQDEPTADGPTALEMQSRTPVQGDGEARQGAAMAAGNDRRAEERAAPRERAAPLGERTANTADRAEMAMRDAPRPSPAQGTAERIERLSQRLNAEGDARQTEGRNNAPLNSAASTRGEQLRADPFAQRVTVLSNQNAPVAPPAPAPASFGLSGASAQVTAAIREDVEQVSRAAAARIEAQDSVGSRGRPVHTLQIQLQPADLGRVNARMSIEGSQLRVELQVETEQARAALAKDADSILKSLKAAGFDIDRVTIQQAQPASNAAQTGNQDRGASPFATQDSGADDTGDQGRQRGAGNSGRDAPQEGHDGAPQNDTRGGLFI